MSGLPAIVSFWHGRLGWLERLCIASFVAQGHRFRLYAYDALDGLPAGAELVDAATILPRQRMFFYKGSRTPAVFADLFRLELMRHGAGIWADCDVLCLKPFAGLGDYVFGIEGRRIRLLGGAPQVNNAVFHCPADSELLRALLATFEPGAIPGGMPWQRRLEVRLRRAFGDPLPVEHMQFGATGPWPLNYHLHRLDLFRLAQPRRVFYPLLYPEAGELVAPVSRVETFLAPETLAIHTWHSALTGRGRSEPAEPPPESFLARQARLYGVPF